MCAKLNLQLVFHLYDISPQKWSKW